MSKIEDKIMEKVIVTPSGLRIMQVEEGEGVKPKPGQTVVAHYEGYLEDGTIFDRSVSRNQPFEFPVGQGRVIKGWDEGVAGMKKGGKRTLIIPPELGYGERGYPGVIPPNSVIIFEVEIVDIK